MGYAVPGVNLGYGLRNVDESRQLHFVEHHPAYFLRAIGTTLGRTWRDLLHEAVRAGSRLVGATRSRACRLVADLRRARCRDRVGRGVDGSNPSATPRAFELANDAIVAFGTFVALFLLAYTPVGTRWRRPVSTRFRGVYLVPVLAIAAVTIAPRLLLRITPAGVTDSRSAAWTWTPWVFVSAALVITALGLTLHYY